MSVNLVGAAIVSAVALQAWTCQAGDRVEICAKYRTNYGWSKAYQVEATKVSGYELNTATRSYDFEGYSTYVVIFWDKNEASIIKMPYSFLSPMYQEGEDRRGVRWQIAETSYCF